MQDMVDVLRTLPHAVPSGPATADVVAGDVARGRRALIRRRYRRLACSSAVVAAAAIVAAAVGAVGAPRLGDSAPITGATHESQMQLVAYTGTQPAGFKVSTVPAGWHVISSDRTAFVVAPPGANTSEPAGLPGVSFVGRIAVALQGMSRLPSDSPVKKVTVNGKQGRLGVAHGADKADLAVWLIFPDGVGHNVLVQVPKSLGLTDDQIVRFAQGVTVTGEAEAAAG